MLTRLSGLVLNLCTERKFDNLQKDQSFPLLAELSNFRKPEIWIPIYLDWVVFLSHRWDSTPSLVCKRYLWRIAMCKKRQVDKMPWVGKQAITGQRGRLIIDIPLWVEILSLTGRLCEFVKLFFMPSWKLGGWNVQIDKKTHFLCDIALSF